MRSKVLGGLLALALASGRAPLPASDLPAALTAGISLVREGDFEAAVVKLDAAVTGLEPYGGRTELAQAYLFLGVAYLELDQEALARGKFAQALERAPELRLDPSEFSPQVIRVFEATRQEALPAATGKARVSRTGAPSGAEVESGGRWRSSLPLLILGGAAAAGGAALASGGSASPPSAAPSPTPTPGASPTPRPAPEPPPVCTYRASPRTRGAFDDDGGSGVCNIIAPAACAWSAVSTNPNWLVITAGATGRGSDEVRFKVRPNNNGNQRTASIQLVEDESAFCRIDQDDGGGSGPGLVPSLLAWSSDLEVAGGAGRISVDGAHAVLVGSGRSQGARLLPRGSHRIEALLSSGRGQPGVWRFRFGGAFRPGSLRLRAGMTASVTSEAIVFRLRGTPGERVVFDLEADR